MKPTIAFYAPLKPPDHPIPSGDREIARLMTKALKVAGYEVEVASRFVSYQKHPSRENFLAHRNEGGVEARRLLERWRGAPPDLWFTYHPYCKAPDWIGPAVADALSIPYVTAEACRTRQATDEDWREARAAVQQAVRRADVNFCLKPSDEAYLRSFLPDMKNVTPLKPFLDVQSILRDPAPNGEEHGFARPGPVIVAVGMMRPGAKMQSYRLLAAALAAMADIPWNLVVIGDGPGRPEAESLFGFAGPERAHFVGAASRSEVLAWMKAGDVLAWPGIGEAIGMAYLEAGASGLPVAACKVANVAMVVADGESGLLADEPTVESYRAVLTRLLSDHRLRLRLAEGGRKRIAAQHDIAAAATVIKGALDPLIRQSNARGGPAL